MKNNATFSEAVRLAKANRANWQGDLNFADLVGYYIRHPQKRRKRSRRAVPSGPVPVGYRPKQRYYSEEWATAGGEEIGRITLKTERPFEFWHDVCDTTDYFAEGCNWPQRRKGQWAGAFAKEASRRAAADARAECRQRVYS